MEDDILTTTILVRVRELLFDFDSSVISVIFQNDVNSKSFSTRN